MEAVACTAVVRVLERRHAGCAAAVVIVTAEIRSIV
jgi:hypothetical protein